MKKTGFLLILLSFASFGHCQGDPDIVDAVIKEGREHSQAIQTLKELCDKIGGRVTGSPTLDRGIKWALAKFKDYGCTNIHTEQWGTWDLAFDRGKRQSVRMVSPEVAQFDFSTPCFTVGTSGPVRGKVVFAPTSMDDARARVADFKGAYVLMTSTAGMRLANVAKPTELDTFLDKAGIVGRIWGTAGPYVWTHGRPEVYNDENRPKTPLVFVTKDSFEMLKKNIELGKHPVVECNIENLFFRRPTPLYNVVAEIKGTSKPEEVVIVSGHFDSWNGPGSQGASDNGTGSCAALEAARILNKVGARPKRTIRFILWTGEEQGLLGSTGYVKYHKADLDKIDAVLVEDEGQNWESGIPCLKDEFETVNEAATPLAAAFPGMPYKAHVVDRLPSGGSDHGPFISAGVPAFALDKDHTLSYTKVWHTQFDRWEEVPAANLAQMSTCQAVMAYNLACSADFLPRLQGTSGRS